MAPPIEPGRNEENRARQLIQPPKQPIVPVPVAPPPDEGKTTDELIQRLGRELKEQPPTTQEPPPPPVTPPPPITPRTPVTPPTTPVTPPPTIPRTYSPPENPPYRPGEPPPPPVTPPPPPEIPRTYSPPDHPPPHRPDEPPPPHRPEEPPPPHKPDDTTPCCGKIGNLITFPRTTDPMTPPKQLEAARDPAVGGVQVFLHDGGFFTNAVDVTVPKFFYNMQWSRHYRSDAKFNEGGLLGHGWDFFFNKRIVPWGNEYQLGLLVEHAGSDIPKLMYYNGAGRGEWYSADPRGGGHSEERDVENFDMSFRAYVSTYVSPPGTLHEIERYILLPGQPHPFQHPNVEKTERIFYVLREKDGTRYVFNCRGQLIYILSRNDSETKHIRVELHYREPLNSLTQNPMLYEILPAVGKPWSVDTVAMGEGPVLTNVGCVKIDGTAPILHVQRVRTETVTIVYNYKSTGDGPELDSVQKSAADKAAKYAANSRRWEYNYDGGHRMTDIKSPKECAKGSSAKPYLHNTYAGDSVEKQTVGDNQTVQPDSAVSRTPVTASVPMSYSFRYSGSGATVTDAKGNEHDYGLEYVAGYPVVARLILTDADSSNGEPWITRYKHNGQTQIEEITYPAGNGITFKYETENKSVTLGPIRDWVERKWTYEHDLATGNLRAVTRHEGNMGKTVTRAPNATYSGPSTSTSERSYEQLYNQLEESKDPNGNITKFHYTDYDTPKHRGNPMSMQDPPIRQPDDANTLLPRPETTFTYDAFAQHETATEDGKVVAKYEYNDARYIRRAEYTGGSFENLRYDALGNILHRESQDGVVDYERDAFGQVKRKIVDPTGLALKTEYDYDDDGNTTEVRTEVKDTFGSDSDVKEAKALGLTPAPTYWQTEASTYDLLGRGVSRKVSGQGQSYETVTAYGSTGDVDFTLEPPRNAADPFKTTMRHDARHLVRETVTAAGTSAEYSVRQKYDDNGNPSSIEYSGSDTVRSTMHYNGLDRVDVAVDALGAQTNTVYDAVGNVTEVTVKGAAGVLHRATYDYDAYQQVIRRSVDTLTGAKEVSRWFYSDRLLLARTISPNGSETKYEYDPQDRLEYVTDGLGDKTRNVYSPANNLSRVEVTATERSGDPTSGQLVEQARTVTTTSLYDSAGRVTSVITPAGRERRFLDSLGRPRGTVSVTNQLTTFVYDGLGRQTDLKNGLTTLHKTYTPGGYVKESTGGDGNFAFLYDALGRMVRRTDTDTSAATGYNYRDGVVEMTDGNGTKVRTTYNGGKLPVDVTAEPSKSTAPDDSSFAIVAGMTREHFDYDELGRVTKATSGDSVTIVRTYDGLDRLTGEDQTAFGTTRTVKYSYAEDFSWTEVAYPDIAGGVRYRYHSDELGRIDKLTLDGSDVASYRYTGLDRIAQRSLANSATTTFGYDDASRLNDVTLVSGVYKTLIWRLSATYDKVGFSSVTDFTPGGGIDGGDIANVTYLKRDPLGRLQSTRTGLLTSAQLQLPKSSPATKSGSAKPPAQPPQASGVLSEVSGTYNVYDGSRLAATAEYGGVFLPRQGAKGFVGDVLGCLGGLISCMQGAPVRTLRVDRFAYGPRQRIDQLTTSGAFNGRVETFPNSLDAIASLVQVRSGVSDLFTAGSRTPPTEQKFQYDKNGNLIADGRYHYAYDFKNRLVLVQDTYTPNGYDEYTLITYDPFSRRLVLTSNRIETSRKAGGGIQFNNPWTGGNTRLIYDGEHVVAEVWFGLGGEGDPRLIARYFYGARPGELLRMDGRPYDQPKQPLETFYVHEDLNGSIRYVTDDKGLLHPIDNEMPIMVGQTGADAAPGDRVVIGASGVGAKAFESSHIRMPYIGSGTRVDGFSALDWSDDAKQAVFNWRGAPNFARATERRIIADERLMLANRLQATVGVFVALPIGLSIALPATTLVEEVTWGSLGWSAVTGGGIQAGFGRLSSWANDAPYEPGDAALDFLQGATFGLTNKVIGGMGLSMSTPAKAGIELALTSAGAAAYGVARSGHLDLDEMLSNSVTAVAVQGTGSAIGWVWRRGKGALTRALFESAESTRALPAPVKEETIAPSAPAEATPVPSWEHAFDFNGLAITDELRAVPAKIIQRMEASRIPQVRETVQRLRAGLVKIKFYGKGATVLDPGALKEDTSRFWAYWNNKTKDVLWLNAEKFGNGAVNDVFATSIVVHESIHAMGGNELCAFMGQARFVLESGQWAGVSHSFRAFLFTYLKGQLNEAIHAIGERPDPTAPGGIFGYARRGDRWIRPRAPDAWVIQQGGWARALDVPHQGFDMAVLGPSLMRTITSPP